ncbi:MFS transporter [Rheinheimera marina]|uniref:MFS transporter n=1 Tax=Rheinheimera marina TaxID=1774958 RepID=A0ABV9JQW6_9GAMM
MSTSLRSFSSLYSATLLALLASGVLTTYLGLRLAADQVAQIWIGGMMSAYYLGLVGGSKVGHRLIAQVGHIRTFVASAGVTSASALGHALIDDLAVWLVLRLLVGTGMMCMYMVLESWLNEQADSKNRGTVFASYMIVSYLGLMLGQAAISISPELDLKPLLIVGMCFALCLVPLALTRRIHPAPLQPAPLKIRVFWQQVPQSLTTVAMAGVIAGSFYGLAPAYVASQGGDTKQVALYMSCTIVAGLLAQWPMGKLSDRVRRSRLIRTNTVILGSIALCIALLPLAGWLQLVFTFAYGIFAFTLYPLGTALANQNVEQSQRVALSATILLTFGLGASIGPLLASGLVQLLGYRMLYGFIALCTLLLFLRLSQVNYQQKQQDKQKTQDYVMASGDLVSSPLAAALDPRVDEQTVQQQMVQPVHMDTPLPNADQELSSQELSSQEMVEPQQSDGPVDQEQLTNGPDSDDSDHEASKQAAAEKPPAP